ncbi:MAG TPA: hypothetical protein VFE24_12130 [Pirellulales bacterium]|jgi:hypothetical protein|nr:hypothetical protein [Pirellulales bacterium]
MTVGLVNAWSFDKQFATVMGQFIFGNTDADTTGGARGARLRLPKKKPRPLSLSAAEEA